MAILISNNSAIVDVLRKEGKVENSNIETSTDIEILDYYSNDSTDISNLLGVESNIIYKYEDTDGDYVYDQCRVTITGYGAFRSKGGVLTTASAAKGWVPDDADQTITNIYTDNKDWTIEKCNFIDGNGQTISIGIGVYEIESGLNSWNVREKVCKVDNAIVTYKYMSNSSDLAGGQYDICEVTIKTVVQSNTCTDSSWDFSNGVYTKTFNENKTENFYDRYNSISIVVDEIGNYKRPATEITIDHTKESIQKDGGELYLTATVGPNNVSSREVKWTSSNENIVQVDNDSNYENRVKVSGVGIGTATITATAMGTNGRTVEATCEILVNQKEIETSKNVGTVTYIYKDSNNNGRYDSCIVKIKLKALTYAITDEEWSYDNEEYCKEYFEIKNESVNVTDKGAFFSSIDINVTEIGKYVVPVTQISLDKDNITENVGSSEILKANIVPTHASNKKVEWMTSDETIATVSNGTVRGVREGTATITVKAKGTDDGTEITDTCTVIVRAIPVNNVTIDKSSASIQKGKTQQLRASITPSNATNKNLTWTSSNTSVATVDQNGLVRGVGVGTATITVTTEDGRKTATCNMEVTSPTLERIVVDDSRTKKQYNEGDLLDLSGLEVKAFYSDDAEETITDYITNPQDRSQLVTSGIVKVTVEYQGKTDEFEINVAPKLTGIKITNPDKTTYKKGEKLDLTGLKVEAVYSDGPNKPITDYEIDSDVEEGEILEDVGEKEITIKYQEMEDSFIITVTEEIITPTLNKIVITEEPRKKEYKQGEQLDLSGLKVEAVYTDGAREPIINYITNPKEGEKLTEVGDKRITIEYEGMEDSFIVTVKEDKNEDENQDGNGSGNQDGNGNTNGNGSQGGSESQGKTETPSSNKVSNNGKGTNANTAPKILPKTGIGETIRMYAIAFSIVMAIIGMVVICSYVRYRKTPRE